MPMTEDIQDERLVELLDDALRELRSGRPLDTMAWHERHPELGREGASLLATLVRFATSADDWRAALPLPRKSTAAASGTAVEESLLPGQIGRYMILARVGTGAMGTVYRAHDPQLDRLVAVKVPRMDKLPRDKATFTERFLREARHAASVRHPHICPIYDAGQYEGQPFVVMAYVDGEPLDSRLGRIGRFEDARLAVRLAIQVAQALAAVHSHQIIHRDLKPANILLDRSGQALLTDFGLAREIESGDHLTMEGVVVGTPSYMSPEQATGQHLEVGPPADIYSLGVVLYEMLTGKLPFRGSVCEILRKIVVEAPVSPVELRRDLDPRLAELVLKSIAKSPADRIRSAENFAYALQGWLDSHPGMTMPDLPPAGRSTSASSPQTVAQQAAPQQAAAPAQPAGKPSRRRRLAEGATAAMLLVAAGFGFYAWNHDRAHEIAPQLPAEPGEKPRDHPKTTQLYSARLPLTGHLKLKFIGSPQPESGKVTARATREGDTAPLIGGQRVQLQVTLNRPGHVYLFWIDRNGATAPIYPWDFGHSKKLWDAPWVPDSESPAAFIRCPQNPRMGFRAAFGTPGMQHVVLLARTAPIDSPNQLRSIFSDLPASPLGDGPQAARYFDWRPGQETRSGLVRGLVPGAEDFTGEAEEEQPTAEADESGDPILALLKERVRPYEFELIKVWRFAQVAE